MCFGSPLLILLAIDLSESLGGGGKSGGNGSDVSDVNQSTDRLVAGVCAVFWFGNLVLQAKVGEFAPSATRCGVLGSSDSHACSGGAAFPAVDVLGKQAQRRSLSRFTECRSRSYIVSGRIFVPRAQLFKVL